MSTLTLNIPTDPIIQDDYLFCVNFISKWGTPARLALFNKATLGDRSWASVSDEFSKYLDRLDEIENTYRVRPAIPPARVKPRGGHYAVDLGDLMTFNIGDEVKIYLPRVSRTVADMIGHSVGVVVEVQTEVWDYHVEFKNTERSSGIFGFHEDQLELAKAYVGTPFTRALEYARTAVANFRPDLDPESREYAKAVSHILSGVVKAL